MTAGNVILHYCDCPSKRDCDLTVILCKENMVVKYGICGQPF